MEMAVTTGLTNNKALTTENNHFLARDWIAGLERGLGVIEAFDENHSRMTAQQVGERCGLSRTAARRYLLTLQHLGYVSSDSKQFWLTPRIMRLGQSYLSSARLPRIAQPVLQRVSASLQEVVYLAVLDAGEVVYVSRNGPNRAMSSGFVLGARVPGHVTSAGMLMLANLPSAQLEEWFATH
jgi:IclR family pca regulon transcriptional regulator